MRIWWFSRIIAHHPYAIFTVVCMFSSTCLLLSLTTEKFPDFSDPQLGFEARGTELSERLSAWDNLIKASTSMGNLMDDPAEFTEYLQHTYQQIGIVPENINSSDQRIRKKKTKNKKVKKWQNDTKKENVLVSDNAINHFGSDEVFFCNPPSPSYARVVIGSHLKNRNLWSLEGVLAQCRIDETLRSNPYFISLCQLRLDKNAKNECCRSWTPANYVAFLSNRTSCLEVTANDLDQVEKLLQRCAHYYHNRQLTGDCGEDSKCQKDVPTQCYKYNAAYYLLHYLLDSEFISNGKVSSKNSLNPVLQSGMLILPIAASAATLDFYKSLQNEALVQNGFYVQGMELGLKSTLFDRLLVSDSILLLFSFAFIFICIWTYTSSLLLTTTTILTVVFSLGISYTLYTMILKIKFFPFMNLLAIIVAVGIGADNSFIYYKVWESKKKQLSNTKCVQLVQESLEHALPSMIVTSLTTAVAFFVSIVSNVTAINCFSLFSGITVLANFFLMITWLPACVVISERCQFTVLSSNNFIEKKLLNPIRVLLNELEIGFSTICVHAVIRFRWIWLLSLGGLTILGCIIVFKYPGLRLPDSPHFQLFKNSHPFEQYDLINSQQFRFENPTVDFGETITMPLRFVWGIKPVDNGDSLNPYSKGTIEWDEKFDVSHPESQKWLYQFCQNLRSQSFYRSTLGPLLSNCFIETLHTWMKRRCKDPLNSSIDRTPCCEKSKFPYTPQVLKQCAVKASIELYRTPTYLWSGNRRVTAGLKFFKETRETSLKMNKTGSWAPLIPKIKAVVIEYDSTYPYSLSFADMNTFYHEVETWMQSQLKSAPIGMQGGWFISKFEFYELQNTLYHGTMWAMGLSIILALAVIAITTLNPFISLYTMFTIGAAIIVSTMVLVLLGWKLNVLESVAVSTAIGLAVDFSLHYGVSYKISTNKHRLKRVELAIKEMSGPTLMAAITSGTAGAFMLPSSVLAYIQIGVFLLIVMTISWIYATFFLCSTLAIFGPSSNFAQFEFPWFNSSSSHFHKEETENMSVDSEIRQNKSENDGKGKLSESILGSEI